MRARQDAENEGCGLRIKLRLNAAPELADLPWEFFYDGRDFLALSDDGIVFTSLRFGANFKI
jgi:hypothetical protein